MDFSRSASAGTRIPADDYVYPRQRGRVGQFGNIAVSGHVGPMGGEDLVALAIPLDLPERRQPRLLQPEIPATDPTE